MITEHTTTARGAARLRSLTDAATTLFLSQGYEAVSLDELINRVGGSRRTIYDRFGGKRGLFIEVMTKLCEELDQSLVELDLSGQGVREALHAFAEETLKIVLNSRTLALHRLMIAEGQRFPDVAQAIYQAGHEKSTHRLATWISAWQSAGQLRGGLAAEDLAAQFVDMLVTGPQLRALLGFSAGPASDAELSRLACNAVGTFLDGAGPHEGAC